MELVSQETFAEVVLKQLDTDGDFRQWAEGKRQQVAPYFTWEQFLSHSGVAKALLETWDMLQKVPQM